MLNRLVRQYTQGTTTTLIGQYRYDILNNRTRLTDAAGNYLSYLYDTVGGTPANVGAQQLNQIDLYNAAGVKQSTQGTFSYDAAGNLTGKSIGGSAQTLVWDANNDLRQVLSSVLSGGTTTTYNEVFEYDHEARRITRQMATGSTVASSLYWYNGEDIHKEYGFQWVTPAAAYTHGPNTDDPLIHQSAAGNGYYHADGLGSPTLLTDASGNLRAYRRFDPWGRAIGAGGAMPTYGFTGREPDLSTGYTYYRARYYDPVLGRFISRDPIGLEGGINVYTYVENNPTNFTDPSGLYAKSITNTVSNVGAAIGSYYDAYSVGTRLQGAAQLGFGVLEASGGAALGVATSWTGVGAVAGVAVFGMGADNATAGLRTMISGQATPTLMDRGMASAGVNPLAAAGIGIVLSGGTNANAWAKGAANVANGPRLANQLVNESARSPFTATGTLTREALSTSRAIPNLGPGQLSNPAIPKGFGKYTTETFQSPAGDFQMHFYMNPKTGEPFYGLDYKAIFNNAFGAGR